MRRYYRLHNRNEDPESLLHPEAQHSQPWNGGASGRCDKCGGDGRTDHECEACREHVDPNCPACDGRVNYSARCPACQGTGEITDDSRRGVSVFPDVDGLFRYMVRRGADLSECMLVVLEGEPSEDEDFDADEGAILIHPTVIVDTHPVEDGRIERAREQLAERGEAA